MPPCDSTSHAMAHLFSCSSNPTSLTTISLWTRPVDAAGFLKLIALHWLTRMSSLLKPISSNAKYRAKVRSANLSPVSVCSYLWSGKNSTANLRIWIFSRNKEFLILSVYLKTYLTIATEKLNGGAKFNSFSLAYWCWIGAAIDTFYLANHRQAKVSGSRCLNIDFERS